MKKFVGSLWILFAFNAGAGPMLNRLSRGACEEHLAGISDDVWIWANRRAKQVFGPELFANHLQIHDFLKESELKQIERTFEIIDVLLHLAQQSDSNLGEMDPIQDVPWQLHYQREKGPGDPPGLSLSVLGDRLVYSTEAMMAGEFVMVAYAQGPSAEATLDRVRSLTTVMNVPFDANELRFVQSSSSPVLFIAVDRVGDPSERFIATLHLLRGVLHEVQQLPRSSWAAPLE